jgi:cytochrome c peroxidase
MKKLLTLFLLCSIISCERDPEIVVTNDFTLEVPNGFPTPHIPDDNQLTWERITLGKRLFFDPILSLDSTISCGSCHKQEFAFADNLVVTPGVENRLGTRNSMSLANVAYHDFFLREGGVPTLEMQVLAPIQDHNEMSFNIISVAERLKKDSSYVKQSIEAYDKEPDAFVITRSIAAFERTMISGNSKYDKNHLNSSERRGKDLFFSDSLACASCHGSFLFSNQGIENNGLYENYSDSGRFRLTHLQEDIGKFKVPTLRNIELTSPYMHDGSIESLDEVINHYASGGANHFNQNELIKGFSITENEKADLINFLNSLTDQEFIQNSLFEE